MESTDHTDTEKANQYPSQSGLAISIIPSNHLNNFGIISFTKQTWFNRNEVRV
jgi:hypothetical protein